MAFFPIDRTSICFGELSFLNDPLFFAFQIARLFAKVAAAAANRKGAELSS